MKKNIGAKLALYPTPLVVVGTMVNGKPNWTLVGHLGIIGHDRVMVSMSDSHYSNQGIWLTLRWVRGERMKCSKIPIWWRLQKHMVKPRLRSHCGISCRAV